MTTGCNCATERGVSALVLENARADASARGGGDAARPRVTRGRNEMEAIACINFGGRSPRDFRVIELRHDAAVRALISPAAATRDADDAPRVYI